MRGKKTFVIIGLGLLGGSLAAAIRRRFQSARVIAASRTRRHIAFAKRKKFIHFGTTDLKAALRNADFVLVCTPVDTIPGLIEKIERHAKQGAIVTDVGSTKGTIVRSADRMQLQRVSFIGSHPLAGSHLTGVEHAQADLFEGCHVFLTPTSRSDARALRAVKAFWRKLNARILVISPEKHDRLVSEISHLPHAAAAALMHSVSNASLRLGASGFLDTTRVAQGDPNLWVPIFLTNRAHLISHLRRLKKTIHDLEGLLKKRSRQRLARFLRVASLNRRGLS